MRRTKRLILPLLALLSVLWLPNAHALVQPADVITVGNVVASGAVVDVPIYIRDTSGSPVGIDQPAGSKLQSYAIKVDFSPTSAVANVTPGRAGITASLTPLSEFTPVTSTSATIIDTFSESTNLIPFTSNAALPGNQVAHMQFMLSPSVVPGSVITLTLDPTLTQVANEGGTTNETVNNGTLTLVAGSITIPPTFVYQVPALSHWALMLLAMTLAVVAVRFRM
jgi:hypothetical protein